MEQKADRIVRKAALPLRQEQLPLVRQAKLATVVYEDDTTRGAIISPTQYDMMPEDLRFQVRVMCRDANGIAIEGESSIIEDILVWTMESELGVPGLDLGEMNKSAIEGLFRLLEEVNGSPTFPEESYDDLTESDEELKA